MDLNSLRNLTEAYAAVYDEDLRDELEEMSDDFSGVEDLSDEEIDEIIDETIDEMFDEGYDFGEVEDLLEGVLLELNPYAPAGSKGAKEYARSTSATKKSAERSASRAATVSRVKGAVKGAIQRLRSTAGSIGTAAKSAGRSAKFHSVDKSVAAYANKRKLDPAPGMAARSKDPAKRRGLRSKVVSDIASRVKGKLKSAVSGVKQKAASAAVSGYAAGRAAKQAASDSVNKTKQSAKNLATRAGRSVKTGIKGAIGAAASRVASGASRLSTRMATEEVDVYDIVISHLLDEGYADTYESAESIMVNMSEEWRESILLDEYEDEKLLNARKKSISRLNAAKDAEDNQADGDYENSVDPSNPTLKISVAGRSTKITNSNKGKSGYMEVPTDYRARKRRASGR
jgi:hypothetical protein